MLCDEPDCIGRLLICSSYRRNRITGFPGCVINKIIFAFKLIRFKFVVWFKLHPMRFLLIVLLLSFTCSSAFSQTYEWTQRYSFPGNGRYKAVSFVIGDTAYVGTGKDESTYYKDFYKYDPVNNSWTPIADLPGEARYGAVAFTANGKGYVGTGANDVTGELSDFYEYDPATGEWMAVADFKGSARSMAVAFSIDGKGYVGTGKDATDETADFYKYDPLQNEWTQVAGLAASGKRTSAVGFSIAGKGYIVSGSQFDGSSTAFSDIYSYDPETDSWNEEIFADILLSNKQNAAAFVYEDKAYIIGGSSNKTNIVYDPADNSLSELLEPGPSDQDKRTGAVAFSVGEMGYVCLGYYAPDIFTTYYLTDLWRLERIFPKPAFLTFKSVNIYEYDDRDGISVRMSVNNPSFIPGDTMVFEKSVNGGKFERYDHYTSHCCMSSGVPYENELDSVAVRTYTVRGDEISAYSDTLLVKDIIRFSKLYAGEVSENYVEVKLKNTSDVELGYLLYRKTLEKTDFSLLDTLWQGVDYDDADDYISYIDGNVIQGEVYRYTSQTFTENIVSDTSTLMASMTPMKSGKWSKVDHLGLDTVDYDFAAYCSNILYLTFRDSRAIKSIDLITGEHKPVSELPLEILGIPRPVCVSDELLLVNNGNHYYGQVNEAYKYTEDTDSWVAIADKPSAGSISVLVTDHPNDDLYVLFDQDDEIWKYNLTDDAWSLITTEYKEGYPGQSYYSNGFLYLSDMGYHKSNDVERSIIDVNDGSVTMTTDAEEIILHPATYTVAPDSILMLGGYVQKWLNNEYSKVAYNRTLLAFNPTTGGSSDISYYNGTLPESGALFMSHDTLFFGLGHNAIDYSPSKELWKYNPDAAAPVFKFETDSISFNFVSLSWLQGSPDTEKFGLYRKENEEDSYELIASLDHTVTSYKDEGLKADQRYYYKLTAMEASIESFGSFVDVKLPASVPVISHFDLMGIAPDSMKLTWYYGNDAPVDSLYILDSGGDVTDVVSSGNDYFIGELTEGTDYEFHVYAKNIVAQSDTVSAFAITPLKAPEIYQLYKANKRLWVKWHDLSAMETGYVVSYESASGVSYFSQLPSDTEQFAFSYEDIDTVNLKVFVTAVGANNSDRMSVDFSDAVDGTPSPIQAVTLSETGSDYAVIQWQPVTDDLTDSVQVKVVDHSLHLAPATVTTDTLRTLIENTHYSVAVSAWNPLTTSDTAVVEFTTRLHAPDITRIINNPGSTNEIVWVDNSGVEANYVIERAYASDSLFSELATTGENVTSYIDNNIGGTETLLYRVFAKTPDNSSAYSAIHSSANVVTGTESSVVTQAMQVFPNPVSGILNLEVQGSILVRSITIYSSTGKVMWSRDREVEKVDVSTFGKGLYFIKVDTDNGFGVRKFLKK